MPYVRKPFVAGWLGLDTVVWVLASIQSLSITLMLPALCSDPEAAYRLFRHWHTHPKRSKTKRLGHIINARVKVLRRQDQAL